MGIENLTQPERQARLLSTHNCVPVNRDLKPKHLDMAIARARGEFPKNKVKQAEEIKDDKKVLTEDEKPGAEFMEDAETQKPAEEETEKEEGEDDDTVDMED